MVMIMGILAFCIPKNHPFIPYNNNVAGAAHIRILIYSAAYCATSALGDIMTRDQ